MTTSEEKTIMEIFLLLKRNFFDYYKLSELEMEKFVKNKREREKRLSQCTSQSLDLQEKETGASEKTNITPASQLGNRKVFTTSLSMPSVSSRALVASDQVDVKSSYKFVSDHNLDLMRENVDLKLKIQMTQEKLADLQSNENVEENVKDKLDLIDNILEKVETTQTLSQTLCEKLSEGIDKLKESRKENQSDYELPVELKRFCDRIKKTVGRDYIPLGRELDIEPDTVKQIERDYEEVGGCLYQIILEWFKRQEEPSLHTLVAACYNVNPDILRCKPLSNSKARLLESKYSFLYDEMHELAVLPHLVSANVMTLALQMHVLKPPTRDQRICRLLGMVCTRENGYEELCNALEKSDQTHVANVLRDGLSAIDEEQGTMSKKIEKLRLETFNLQSGQPALRRRNCYSQNDLDQDDVKSEFSTASSPGSLNAVAVLHKIVDLIKQINLGDTMGCQ